MNNNSLSVIVPNYNYAHFLKRRLDSIANQTIKPSEIIFLDDHSTDDSINVAKNLLMAYGIPYSIITNESNCGVFNQWLKGIALAKYDYIWIAEADDSCKITMLEKLLPAFSNPDVVLSYCQSQYINAQDKLFKAHKDEIANYFPETKRWNFNYVNTCFDEASKYLAVFSCIANASAVVLKKSALPLDKLNQIKGFKIAGDWLFYLLVLFENPELKLAYCCEELNLWYRHGASVWADKDKQISTLMETLKIFYIILQTYPVADTAKKKIYVLLVRHYLNKEIINDEYRMLLFKVFDLSGNKGIVLNLFQVMMKIRFLRVCVLKMANYTGYLRAYLESSNLLRKARNWL